MVDEMRCIALQRLVEWILGVEEAERVLLEPRAALLAQIGKMRPVIRAQQLPVCWTANFIANAVQLQGHARDVEPGKPFPSKHDRLHVEQRATVTDGFDPELVKLSKASGLGPVVAEVRPHVVEPHRLRLLLETAVEVGSHDGGGPFRSQGQRTIASIREGVHLLRDDVTPLAGAAYEEL